MVLQITENMIVMIVTDYHHNENKNLDFFFKWDVFADSWEAVHEL